MKDCVKQRFGLPLFSMDLVIFLGRKMGRAWLGIIFIALIPLSLLFVLGL